MRGFECPSERPPRCGLPGLAAAHGARRELAAHRDSVPALGAAVLPFHMVPGGRELDGVAVGGCGRTLREPGHPGPLISNG